MHAETKYAAATSSNACAVPTSTRDARAIDRVGTALVRQRGESEFLVRAFAHPTARDHNRRSATSSTRWLALFVRIRSARWRVGRMFSCRLTRLMRVQIEVAVSTASSSDKVA